MNIDDMGTWEMTESFWDIYEDYPNKAIRYGLPYFVELFKKGDIVDDEGIAEVWYSNGRSEILLPSEIAAFPSIVKIDEVWWESTFKH